MNNLIVKIKSDADTDLDRLYEIDESLHQAFSESPLAEVDGHDIGEGKFSIYIHLDGAWDHVIETVLARLKTFGVMGEATIAKFHAGHEQDEVIWPVGFPGAFAL